MLRDWKCILVFGLFEQGETTNAPLCSNSAGWLQLRFKRAQTYILTTSQTRRSTVLSPTGICIEFPHLPRQLPTRWVLFLWPVTMRFCFRSVLIHLVRDCKSQGADSAARCVALLAGRAEPPIVHKHDRPGGAAAGFKCQNPADPWPSWGRHEGFMDKDCKLNVHESNMLDFVCQHVCCLVYLRA